jgi:hypothetical protein
LDEHDEPQKNEGQIGVPSIFSYYRARYINTDLQSHLMSRISISLLVLPVLYHLLFRVVAAG